MSLTQSITKTRSISNPKQSIRPIRLERNFFSERLQLISLCTDLVILNLMLFISTLVINTTHISHTISLKWWITFMATANILWLIISLSQDIYKWYEVVKPVQKVNNLLWIIGVYFSILSSVYFYVFQNHIPTNYFYLILPLLVLTIIPLHLHYRTYFLDRMPEFRYAIIGGKPCNIDAIRKIFKHVYNGKSTLVGRFGNHRIDKVRELGDFNDIIDFIMNNSFDKLFYIHSNLSKPKVKEIIELCQSRFIEFEIVPREIDIIEGGTRVFNQDRLPILAPQKEPLQRLRNRIFKRAFDIVFSFLVITLIFSWLFPIISILIKWESKGPTFFVQRRTGYWNLPFNFIKFRSMRVNDESDSKQATVNDNRVTKIGSFLRRTSLDELPQFINVLKGDMSVVGPRPHMVSHTDQYSELIGNYLIRHKVKPGITGWAQINGYRGPTEQLYKMEKRVEHDVHYMKNWTALMDIRCIIMTVVNMIKGEENAL